MKNVSKNRKYTRLEIEQIFEPWKERAGQQAYYSIKEGEVGFCWMKKGSIYSNKILSNNSIQWEDSVGLRSATGVSFFGKMKDKRVFMFIAENEKSKYYYLIGEIANTDLLKVGVRFKKPNIFEVTFKEEIPTIAKELLK